MNKRTATALLATGMLVLTACGDDAKVSGLRDDIKVIPAVSEKSHTETVKKTKKVRTCSKGKCTTTTQPDGTKQVKVIDRKAKAAVYCVELDDVNGKPNDDDRWHEVSVSTYYKWADKSEGAKVTDMAYLVKGCSQ